MNRRELMIRAAAAAAASVLPVVPAVAETDCLEWLTIAAVDAAGRSGFSDAEITAMFGLREIPDIEEAYAALRAGR